MAKIPEHFFSEQLIQCQTITPSLRQHYKKALDRMIGRDLSLRERGLAFSVAVVALGFATWIVCYALPKLQQLAWQHAGMFRLMGFAAAAMLLAMAAWLAWLGWKGCVTRLSTESLGLLMGVFGSGAFGVLFMNEAWAMNDPIARQQFVMVGVVFLALGVFGFLAICLEHYHLETQEKLLRLEYRLAEISEKLEETKESKIQPE